MVLSEETTEKIPSDTIGDRSRDLRVVAQSLNHYATPGPIYKYVQSYIIIIIIIEFLTSRL
jgi:hypothetical protein